MSSTSTDCTSDTANKGRTYHILKYDDKDVPIIEGLKDEILESDDELKNIPIQDLFPIGSMWYRKSMLKDNLSEYATRHNFTVSCTGDNKIVCSRSFSKHKRNPRDFVEGALKVGCKFKVTLQATSYLPPKNDVKRPRKRPDFKDAPVSIMSFACDHSNGCDPSPQQHNFCCSRMGVCMSKIPIQMHWNLCSNMKRHDKRCIATSTTKSVLSGCFPPNHNVTKQDIFQTRIRCRRLMPQFETCEDFKKFEENLKSDSVCLKQVESDLALEDDEANQMMHELFDSTFNSNNCNFVTFCR